MLQPTGLLHTPSSTYTLYRTQTKSTVLLAQQSKARYAKGLYMVKTQKNIDQNTRYMATCNKKLMEGTNMVGVIKKHTETDLMQGNIFISEGTSAAFPSVSSVAQSVLNNLNHPNFYLEGRH